MLIPVYAMTLTHRRGEEGADSGLEQNAAALVLHQQGAVGQLEPTFPIAGDPPLVQRSRDMSEDRPGVEPHAIAGQGVHQHGEAKLPRHAIRSSNTNFRADWKQHHVCSDAIIEI